MKGHRFRNLTFWLVSGAFIFGLAGLCPAQSQSTAPQPVGYENDVNCFGYVGKDGDPYSGVIVSGDAANEQSAFSDFDVVYAENRGGIRAGDQYWIVTPMEQVYDPASGAYMGRFYQYHGYATALCVKERTAILEIQFACTDVPMGAELIPYEPIPVPLARATLPLTDCDSPSGKRTGVIVLSRDGVQGLGEGADVIIDMGQDAGLNPGDFLTIYRYNKPREFDIAANGTLTSRRDELVVPRTVLGEAAILTVGDRWATARITSSTQTMAVGDSVEIK